LVGSRLEPHSQPGFQYGWEPTGTGPPRGMLKADCSGIYHGNDGQLFYARDASESIRQFIKFCRKGSFRIE